MTCFFAFISAQRKQANKKILESCGFLQNSEIETTRETNKQAKTVKKGNAALLAFHGGDTRNWCLVVSASTPPLKKKKHLFLCTMDSPCYFLSFFSHLFFFFIFMRFRFALLWRRHWPFFLLSFAFSSTSSQSFFFSPLKLLFYFCLLIRTKKRDGVCSAHLVPVLPGQLDAALRDNGVRLLLV